MIWKSFGCHWLTSLHSDRAISTDPCLASKEVTKMISKWSNRFMADCKSHQSNPQIPKKMEKFKNKMLTHLRSQAGYAMSNCSTWKIPYSISISVYKGKCLTETDEFTKPKRGQIVAEFDEFPLEHEFTVSFDIMINSAKKGYSNILFATSASPDRDTNQVPGS